MEAREDAARCTAGEHFESALRVRNSMHSGKHYDEEVEAVH